MCHILYTVQQTIENDTDDDQEALINSFAAVRKSGQTTNEMNHDMEDMTLK